MAKYTIRPFNTGYTNSDKKTYIYHHSTHPYRNVEGKVLLPCFAFLVEGGKDPILVDTGMADTERAGKYHHPGSNQPEGYAIHERLASLGIKCEDVRLVILTHMHWDHVFYMEKFVNARFVASRIEYEFALNPIPLYYKSYEHPILGIRRPFEGIKIDIVDGEKEIVEGIRVFPTRATHPVTRRWRSKPPRGSTSAAAMPFSSMIIWTRFLRFITASHPLPATPMLSKAGSPSSF